MAVRRFQIVVGLLGGLRAGKVFERPLIISRNFNPSVWIDARVKNHPRALRHLQRMSAMTGRIAA
jgi:hypothetical protein